MAVRQNYVTYMLNRIWSVTFAPMTKVRVITDSLPNENYRKQCVIKEVMK